MKTVVAKFGGTSLADANAFIDAANIIRSDSARRFVVVSAPGKRFFGDVKITDMLINCAELAMGGKSCCGVFNKIAERFLNIADKLDCKINIRGELNSIYQSITHAPNMDYAASRGEYLNALILADYINFAFVDAKDCMLFDADGVFNRKGTYEKLKEVLSRSENAVLPGFYGAMPNGCIKTFSRGGSDITGAVVSNAVDAFLYENWTDVAGVFTADPNIIQSANVIENITYDELRELVRIGVNVLHEEAILPVREKNIPINIRSTKNPAALGTMVTCKRDMNENDVIGVSGRKGFMSINIKKDGMNRNAQFCCDILNLLKEQKIAFELIPMGFDTLSVIACGETVSKRKNDIAAYIMENTDADSVWFEEGIALVAVVGQGITKNKETVSSVYKALFDSGINIRMIERNSGENSIIISINDVDYAKTIHAVCGVIENGETRFANANV